MLSHTVTGTRLIQYQRKLRVWRNGSTSRSTFSSFRRSIPFECPTYRISRDIQEVRTLSTRSDPNVKEKQRRRINYAGGCNRCLNPHSFPLYGACRCQARTYVLVDRQVRECIFSGFCRLMSCSIFFWLGWHTARHLHSSKR